MPKMATCGYTDYLSSSGGDLGSPDSLADDSFSDSETSSTVTGADGRGPMSMDYLAELFSTDHPSHPALRTAAAAGNGAGSGTGSKIARTKSGRKPCKYVPHAEKPGHVVDKRNARERRRVEAVNSAFVRLRKVVPHENRRKRVSKVKTLRVAMDYISYLQDLIDDYDKTQRLQAMAADFQHQHQHLHHQHPHHSHHSHHSHHPHHQMGSSYGAAPPHPHPHPHPHPAYLPTTTTTHHHLHHHSPPPHPGAGWVDPAGLPPHHPLHQQLQQHPQGGQHHHPQQQQQLPAAPGEAASEGGLGEGRYPSPTSVGVPHSLYYPQEPLMTGYTTPGTSPSSCGGDGSSGWTLPKPYTTYDHS